MSQGESLSGRYGHATVLSLSLSLCRCLPVISGVCITTASFLKVPIDVELYSREVLTGLEKRTLGRENQMSLQATLEERGPLLAHRTRVGMLWL